MANDLEHPQNPLTLLFLSFLNPDKEVFHEVLKEGARETVGLFLENAGRKVRQRKPPKGSDSNGST